MHSRFFCALLTAACLCAQVQVRRPATSNPIGNANAPSDPNSTLKPGTIEGTSLNSITNTPVKKAVVSLRNVMQNFSYMAASDGAGHFQFPEVEPGTYLVTEVSAQGFSYIPPPRTKLPTITVAEGERVTGIKVQLRPLGVISGKVIDEDGEPLPNVNIQALRYDYSRGTKTLMPTGNASTDDRGEYRLFDVPPGRYFLRAAVGQTATTPNLKSDVPETGYSPTFYPGGKDLTQATRPEAAPGVETFGIDFRMRKALVYHIRGKIENARSNLSAVQVQPCDATANIFGNQMGVGLQPDGRFDLGGLSPGIYCISYSFFESNKGISARETVTIADQSIDGLSLTAIPIGDLQGVVQAEGNVSLSTPGQQPIRIDFQPANGIGRFQTANLKDDGTFLAPSTPPATYLVMVNGLPKGTYMKALEYGEQDVSDGVLNVSTLGGLLKIHLASDSGQLNATVVNEKGDPVSGVLVNIVPQGRMANRRDLRKVVASDQNGKFQQSGLAPGDYRVVALDGTDTNLAVAEDFVAELGNNAPSVTVHSGGNESVEVKIVSAEEVDRIKSKL